MQPSKARFTSAPASSHKYNHTPIEKPPTAEAFLFKKIVGEIQQGQFRLRPGKRRVEPPEPFGVQRVFFDVARVDDDGLPLATLSLVAGKRP